MILAITSLLFQRDITFKAIVSHKNISDNILDNSLTFILFNLIVVSLKWLSR